jgi:hypothetical protein
MTYGRRGSYRRGSVQKSGPRPNTYPGQCATCGMNVAAGAGILTGTKQTGYTVTHAPATLHGSPISGGWINGCPEETDRLNAALGHENDSYVQNAENAEKIVLEKPPARSAGKYAYTGSGARMTNRYQRCEDAPCCGCCD